MKDVFIHLGIFCVNTFVTLFRREPDMVEIRQLLLRKPRNQKSGVFQWFELTEMLLAIYMPSLYSLNLPSNR